MTSPAFGVGWDDDIDNDDDNNGVNFDHLMQNSRTNKSLVAGGSSNDADVDDFWGDNGHRQSDFLFRPGRNKNHDNNNGNDDHDASDNDNHHHQRRSGDDQLLRSDRIDLTVLNGDDDQVWNAGGRTDAELRDYRSNRLPMSVSIVDTDPGLVQRNDKHHNDRLHLVAQRQPSDGWWSSDSPTSDRWSTVGHDGADAANVLTNLPHKLQLFHDDEPDTQSRNTDVIGGAKTDSKSSNVDRETFDDSDKDKPLQSAFSTADKSPSNTRQRFDDGDGLMEFVESDRMFHDTNGNRSNNTSNDNSNRNRNNKDNDEMIVEDLDEKFEPTQSVEDDSSSLRNGNSTIPKEQVQKADLETDSDEDGGDNDDAFLKGFGGNSFRYKLDTLDSSSATTMNQSSSTTNLSGPQPDGRLVSNAIIDETLEMLKSSDEKPTTSNERVQSAKKIVRARAELRRLRQTSDVSTDEESMPNDDQYPSRMYGGLNGSGGSGGSLRVRMSTAAAAAAKSASSGTNPIGGLVSEAIANMDGAQDEDGDSDWPSYEGDSFDSDVDQTKSTDRVRSNEQLLQSSLIGRDRFQQLRTENFAKSSSVEAENFNGDVDAVDSSASKAQQPVFLELEPETRQKSDSVESILSELSPAGVGSSTAYDDEAKEDGLFQPPFQQPIAESSTISNSDVPISSDPMEDVARAQSPPGERTVEETVEIRLVDNDNDPDLNQFPSAFIVRKPAEPLRRDSAESNDTTTANISLTSIAEFTRLSDQPTDASSAVDNNKHADDDELPEQVVASDTTVDLSREQKRKDEDDWWSPDEADHDKRQVSVAPKPATTEEYQPDIKNVLLRKFDTQLSEPGAQVELFSSKPSAAAFPVLAQRSHPPLSSTASASAATAGPSQPHWTTLFATDELTSTQYDDSDSPSDSPRMTFKEFVYTLDQDVLYSIEEEAEDQSVGKSQSGSVASKLADSASLLSVRQQDGEISNITNESVKEANAAESDWSEPSSGRLSIGNKLGRIAIEGMNSDYEKKPQRRSIDKVSSFSDKEDKEDKVFEQSIGDGLSSTVSSALNSRANSIDQFHGFSLEQTSSTTQPRPLSRLEEPTTLAPDNVSSGSESLMENPAAHLSASPSRQASIVSMFGRRDSDKAVISIVPSDGPAPHHNSSHTSSGGEASTDTVNSPADDDVQTPSSFRDAVTHQLDSPGRISGSVDQTVNSEFRPKLDESVSDEETESDFMPVLQTVSVNPPPEVRQMGSRLDDFADDKAVIDDPQSSREHSMEELDTSTSLNESEQNSVIEQLRQMNNAKDSLVEQEASLDFAGDDLAADDSGIQMDTDATSTANSTIAGELPEIDDPKDKPEQLSLIEENVRVDSKSQHPDLPDFEPAPLLSPSALPNDEQPADPISSDVDQTTPEDTIKVSFVDFMPATTAADKRVTATVVRIDQDHLVSYFSEKETIIEKSTTFGMKTVSSHTAIQSPIHAEGYGPIGMLSVAFATTDQSLSNNNDTNGYSSDQIKSPNYRAAPLCFGGTVIGRTGHQQKPRDTKLSEQHSSVEGENKTIDQFHTTTDQPVNSDLLLYSGDSLPSQSLSEAKEGSANANFLQQNEEDNGNEGHRERKDDDDDDIAEEVEDETSKLDDFSNFDIEITDVQEQRAKERFDAAFGKPKTKEQPIYKRLRIPELIYGGNGLDSEEDEDADKIADTDPVQELIPTPTSLRSADYTYVDYEDESDIKAYTITLHSDDDDDDIDEDYDDVNGGDRDPSAGHGIDGNSRKSVSWSDRQGVSLEVGPTTSSNRKAEPQSLKPIIKTKLSPRQEPHAIDDQPPPLPPPPLLQYLPRPNSLFQPTGSLKDSIAVAKKALNNHRYDSYRYHDRDHDHDDHDDHDDHPRQSDIVHRTTRVREAAVQTDGWWTASDWRPSGWRTFTSTRTDAEYPDDLDEDLLDDDPVTSPTSPGSIRRLHGRNGRLLLGDLMSLVRERDTIEEALELFAATSASSSTSSSSSSALHSSSTSPSSRAYIGDCATKLSETKFELDRRIDDLFAHLKRRFLAGQLTENVDWLFAKASHQLTFRSKRFNQDGSAVALSDRMPCTRLHFSALDYREKLLELRRSLVSAADQLPGFYSDSLWSDALRAVRQSEWTPVEAPRFSYSSYAQLDLDGGRGAKTAHSPHVAQNPASMGASLLREMRELRRLSRETIESSNDDLRLRNPFATNRSTEQLHSDIHRNGYRRVAIPPTTSSNAKVEAEIDELLRMYRRKLVG